MSELEIQQMSVAERLELIGQLWDSIPDTLESLPIPDWHQKELDKRLAAADAHPELGIPWEQVKARLRGES